MTDSPHAWMLASLLALGCGSAQPSSTGTTSSTQSEPATSPEEATAPPGLGDPGEAERVMRREDELVPVVRAQASADLACPEEEVAVLGSHIQTDTACWRPADGPQPEGQRGPCDPVRMRVIACDQEVVYSCVDLVCTRSS